MLFIFTALRAEAEPFIVKLGLKKQPEESSLQMYADAGGSILLTVTGTGPVRAAAAVGSVLGRLTGEGRREAALLNFGSCADISMRHGNKKTNQYFGKNEDGQAGKSTDGQAGKSTDGQAGKGAEEDAGKDAGGDACKNAAAFLYRIHSLVNLDSGRVWYPDLILKSSLPEAALLSGSRVLYKSTSPAGIVRSGTGAEDIITAELCTGYPVLYDMEGAAIYEAANLFLGPHQMHFLKCVTDAGDAESVTREVLTRCVECAAEPLLAYTEALLRGGAGAAAKMNRVKRAAGEADPERSGSDMPHDAGDSGRDTPCKRNGTGSSADETARIARGLCASVSMEEKLARLIHYAECTGSGWQAYFEKRKAAGQFPVPDRKRGKMLLADFENYISGI